MDKIVRVLVNQRSVSVRQGATILEAAREAGVHVPTLCYHPAFRPRGSCRVCLVEVQGGSKPVPACHTKVRDGMEVTTDSKELHTYRRGVLDLLLSRHPNACMTCEANGGCKLQDLVHEERLEDLWPKTARGSVRHPEHHLEDHTSPAIARDMSKCILCGLCVQACGEEGQDLDVIGFVERGAAALPVTLFDESLGDAGCISCGQCTLYCPVGALTERPDWQRVLEVLRAGRRTTVVQTAPATRVAIGEEFGLPPGSVSTGRLVAALRALGFTFVFDTNFSADLTIMEEATELLSRMVDNRGPLPMFTSCCPGWVNYVEQYHPELIPHLSTTKSPQQMHAAVCKRGPFAEELVWRGAVGDGEEPYVVSVMPCTAKKDEAVRPGMRGDVDAVITTRELARMIRHQRIPFVSLPNDASYDNPLGESTGAGAIFGASGGVMEAALRTASHFLGMNDAPLEWEGVRGVAAGVKQATIPGVGSVAAVSSIASAKALLAGPPEQWRKHLMIEVMACKGGCLGGGGEPKSLDPHILEKRAAGIYAIDRNSPRRRSHENADVQKLYERWLGAPLSHRAERELHTSYAPRKSPRLALARFLDAVDNRDADLAADMFGVDGVWYTRSEGELRGPDAVHQYVRSLPPNPQRRQRHRFVDDLGLGTTMPSTGDTVLHTLELDHKGRILNLNSQAPCPP